MSGDNHYKELGLFQRYTYERADGEALDRGEEHFTLRIDKDSPWCRACRQTMLNHAALIEPLGYVQLAEEMRTRVTAIETRIAHNRAQAQNQNQDLDLESAPTALLLPHTI